MEIPAGFFNVSFNKAMAFGYKTDDVDEFVTKALKITKEFQEENEALQQKLEVLGSNLENYREEEDSLRSALIGAQKLGDSILKDSRQKAEKIISDATARAEQITTEAATNLDKQQYELEQIQAETVDFKEKLFSLYRTHLDIIKNIPSEYNSDRKKPTPKAPSPAQAEAAKPEAPEQDDMPPESYPTPDLPRSSGYDERSSAVYTPDDYAAPTNEQYSDNTDECRPNEVVTPEQSIEDADSHQVEDDDDYYDSPYVIDEPNSDRPFTEPQLYTREATTEPVVETYDEPYDKPYEPTPPPRIETIQPEEDVSIYKVHTRKVEDSQPFVVPPMVQLEFETGGYDDYDDDEFAAEKKLIREANLNRIPYLDDDDDDDFAVQLTSKKKPVVSQKFGVLKFGDSFDLRDD